MTTDTRRQRHARAALTYLVEPGDRLLGALLRDHEPADVVAAIIAGRLPAGPAGAPRDHARGAVTRALRRWAARAADMPTESDLAEWHKRGVRLVCPGEPEWPSQLEALADAAPCALWLRGSADLRFGCLRSVSVVGSRTATAYGAHVATELAAGLGVRGWTVVSSGVQLPAYLLTAFCDPARLPRPGCGCGARRGPRPAGPARLVAAIEAVLVERKSASLRRQHVRLVEGRAEGGHAGAFEVICCDCGIIGIWITRSSAAAAAAPGPYTLDPGVEAYGHHIGLIT
jgi:DNA recombination-mediator protein A